MKVQEVAPGIFVATGLIGANVGLIQTGSGAVLVDSPWVPSQSRAWRQEIERLSPAGVAYLINTDYHLDHVLGDCYLPTALTVAHEMAWKNLRSLDRTVMLERALEQGQDSVPDLAEQLADVHLVLPQMTVGKSMTLWCQGRRIDILHFGGHTSATLGVYVPDQRVLFSGDLVVSGRHPYVGDANSRQWLESLERVRLMEIEVIVPGHGNPGGLEMVDALYDYLKELRTRIEACFQAGHTRRETVERVKLVDAFPVSPNDEDRIRRLLRSGVERVYDEVKKEALRNRQRTQG